MRWFLNFPFLLLFRASLFLSWKYVWLWTWPFTLFAHLSLKLCWSKVWIDTNSRRRKCQLNRFWCYTSPRFLGLAKILGSHLGAQWTKAGNFSSHRTLSSSISCFQDLSLVEELLFISCRSSSYNYRCSSRLNYYTLLFFHSF